MSLAKNGGRPPLPCEQGARNHRRAWIKRKAICFQTLQVLRFQ